MLEEAGVSTLAGSDFGQVAGDHVRISYANSQANLALALEAVGSRVQAVRHWKTFLQRSDVDPPSATFARARLAELSEAQ